MRLTIRQREGLTKLFLQLQSDPDPGRKVSVANIADCRHLLVVDTHHVLPNLQVLLVHLLLEFVVVAHGVRLEGRLRCQSLSVRPDLSDRGAPDQKYSFNFFF